MLASGKSFSFSKFCYVDEEDEDTAVKDESNFQLIPDGTTLIIHWKQQ
jgi:hypothetical protein